MAYTQIINIYQRVIYTHGTSAQLLVKFLQPAQLADDLYKLFRSRIAAIDERKSPPTHNRS